jgi:hypothetical protein
MESNDNNTCVQIQTFLFDKETKREWYMWALSRRSTSSELAINIFNTSHSSARKNQYDWREETWGTPMEYAHVCKHAHTTHTYINIKCNLCNVTYTYSLAWYMTLCKTLVSFLRSYIFKNARIMDSILWLTIEKLNCVIISHQLVAQRQNLVTKRPA